MHFDDHINKCFSGSIFHADFKNAKHFCTACIVFFFFLNKNKKGPNYKVIVADMSENLRLLGLT